jgi:peptidoglycan glycosyltransferase
VSGRNVTWFIAFAGPYGERPHVAIAVVLQNQSSTGGATAAPIARSVMEAILRPSSNP